MNILERIIDQKRKEVDQRQRDVSREVLEKRPLFQRQTLSLREFILDGNKTGIIAEYKRRSPSKGVINDRDAVEGVTRAYAENGASGISVLTDQEFFGGSLEDLVVARKNPVPLLRKDFMIDGYQIAEARAYGADVILLIAACLSPLRVKELAEEAKALQLEVLLELHDESELDHICDTVDLVGVNNRNLKNFEVDLEHAARLAERIDDKFIKVAESGINEVANIRYLKQYGFRGFLIGEFFMKQQNPGKAFRDFKNEL
ncbi:MAG: indole-3-glycerol phosphate synthase TrpC [Flavisolibacter sp.]